ncbi:MAG: arginine--tRNA ligase [Candidatus Woykebacteria bacterium]
MIRNTVKKTIEQVLKEEKFPKVSYEVRESSNVKFGDYSTNVVMKLEKAQDKHSKLECAKKFIAKAEKFEEFSKVDFVEPGFVNFYIEPSTITNNIQKIIKEDESFGENEINKGKKASVEFISANPTGPLHIGNARGGPLGDTIANVLSASGYQVIREYYDNNLGTQVDVFAENLKGMIDGEVVMDQYQGEFYNDLAARLNNLSGKSLDEIRETAIKLIFEEILVDIKSMGIRFDKIQHESDLQKSGRTEKVVKYLSSKGLTKEKDDALWFALEHHPVKDKEAVLRRSDERYTYFADDIAFHELKFENKPDLVVDVLGSNHHGHVPRLRAAVKALGFEEKKFKVILYQYVRVKKGKDIVSMSKRAGNFITAGEVIDEVGRDAFRFFLLSHSPSTHMDFDLELAKKRNESNPVYYVQYAYARVSNILKKAKEEGFSHEKFIGADLSLLRQPQELALAKKLLKLPDLVEDLSESLAVNQFTTYLVELAEMFHKYYESYRVIGEKEDIAKARLNLILATKIVLRNTLNLVGVSAPESM